MVLPVLPTTPFVLLAAICFSAGNSRHSAWLRQNRVFGLFIDNYRTKRGISKLHKTASIAFLWTGLGISAALTVRAGLSPDVPAARTLVFLLLQAAAGVGVTIHLLMIKTRKS